MHQVSLSNTNPVRMAKDQEVKEPIPPSESWCWPMSPTLPGFLQPCVETDHSVTGCSWKISRKDTSTMLRSWTRMLLSKWEGRMMMANTYWALTSGQAWCRVFQMPPKTITPGGNMHTSHFTTLPTCDEHSQMCSLMNLCENFFRIYTLEFTIPFLLSSLQQRS